MRKSILRSLATTAMVALTAIGAQALEVGQKAPSFEAQSTHGTVRLADYLGKQNLVLAFYYADFTST
jgi:thioredoxin-dependent peroxiredoxin